MSIITFTRLKDLQLNNLLIILKRNYGQSFKIDESITGYFKWIISDKKISKNKILIISAFINGYETALSNN